MTEGFHMKISRRDFLKMGGGAGFALAMGGGLWKWSEVPLVENVNEPGVEKWIPTICAQCMGGCGVLVRVIDGWAVNIAGNPLHPVNQGTLCPKGIAGTPGTLRPGPNSFPAQKDGKKRRGPMAARLLG